MPDEIIVASWRDRTVSSDGLTRLGPSRISIFRPDFFSSSAMTLRPRPLSSEVTACLSAPSISPFCGMPDEVDGLEGERRHQAALAISALPAGISISLRSSSGLDERVSAIVLRDPARADEAGERGVHRLHAVRRARLDERVDLVRLALADEVADARRRDQHLGGDAAAAAVGGRDQRLGDDALEADRELRADLALLGRREDVDDAVDRLRRVLRVERREDEVAGLRRGQRRADRLHVAHLADEDHVGVLAQGGLERHRERLGVAADLALVDDAALVAVEELDRVLDRHDVLVARLVDLVDHRGERRRLARAGRARDEHDAARLARELADDRRQAELLDRHRLGGDQAERRADRAALEVRVDAEAGVARGSSRRSRSASRSPGAAAGRS